jgi:pyridinium-3,5-bisthiocarboxylic acid mononucleotide nickel chelatase
MRVEHIGYGAGTRNPKDFPNVLRLNIGETADATHSSVAVLETALDDLSPQILAHVTERAFTLGALDVMSTAVQMKKGRLGTLLTILADDAQISALEDLLLRETSTLGVRIHHERRSCLDRAHTAVTTPYGDIRIKIGSRNGEIFNAAPEFEDCRTAAAQHNVPVKLVQQAAIAAYLR